MASEEDLHKWYEAQIAAPNPPSSEELQRAIEVLKRRGKSNTMTGIRQMVAPGPGAITKLNPPPHRYYDYDDFRRDTDQSNVCHIEHIDHSNDWCFVRNQANGQLYRLTGTQARQEGMDKYVVGEQFTLRDGSLFPGHKRGDVAIYDDVVPDCPTTHVLHQGSALCNLVSGRPVDWPKNHEWVSVDHCKNTPEGERMGVTCMDCLEALKKHITR